MFVPEALALSNIAATKHMKLLSFWKMASGNWNELLRVNYALHFKGIILKIIQNISLTFCMVFTCRNDVLDILGQIKYSI